MKKTNEELDRLLSAFKRGALEDFFTLSTFLKGIGISKKRLKDYLEWRGEQDRNIKRKVTADSEKVLKENEEMREHWKKNSRKCPKCGLPLSLSRISTPKGTANKKGWRSLWFCREEDCAFEEYSTEFTDKIYTEIMEGTYNADN